MKSEFSERNYEFYLNCELTKQDIFIPTQRLEGFIGTDSILYLNSLSILRWIDEEILTIPTGIQLTSTLWGNTYKNFEKYLPKFKANLFIQNKISEYIKNKRTKGFNYWNKPYFKYKIDKEQQKILSSLEDKLDDKALVIYACPAFYRIKELFEIGKNNNIIKNSNFVKSSCLNSHNVYSFVNGGNHGYGFSKPSEIPTVDIIKEIKRLKPYDVKLSNSEFIKSLANTIEDIVTNLDYNILKFNWKEIINFILKRLEMLKNHERKKLDPSIKNLIKIFAFLYLTNLSWLIVY